MALRKRQADSLSLETSLSTLSSFAWSFWYVKSTILQQSKLYLSVFSLFYCYFRIEHLTYLPAQPSLAEAVPGDEGDYPYISRGPVIRNQSLRACVRCEHGGGDI